MMIGISGVHGTGKTSLAREAAEKLGFHFCKTSVADVYKRLGKDPSVRMTFDERMECQYEILNELRVEWLSYAGENAIADRTPLDLMVYALADVDTYDVLTKQQEAKLSYYLGNCLGTYVKFFDKIVVTPNVVLAKPGETDKVRANASWGYCYKYDALLRGILSQHSIEFTSIRSLDLAERVEEIRALTV
ncbi:Uncharacterised protein [Ectopseudomonas mendocina]|uniref:NadR/Ttd14 AAA domain-containing protein n=1 Tax=Ectopseudomonas mendocina TaxID=300 RepID=A0A379PLN9_ECTME|nr:AAA family ATPase [Pseudomonas mendocina]SUE95870.1 Uncharacterised protein [Pseudomonas mendocina]